MKTVCIGGAGGVAGIGLTRCLKRDDSLVVVGYDGSRWGELAMECPFVGDPYMSDMIIPVADGLVKKYVDCDICYMPNREIIELCQDKARTAQLLGELAPKLYWVRDTHGAGGAGAQMASELLPGRNYSIEILYYMGEIIGSFAKERLSYDIKGSKDPINQRGSSVVSVCIDTKHKGLIDKAVSAINLVTNGVPVDGVFSIDFKEDENGDPKITEINPGRFLTASYPYFEKFYNLPLYMVKKYFNEPYVLGEYPEGWGVIRQQDSPPKFFTPEQTERWREND